MAVWQQAAATIVSPAIASPAVAVAQATGQPASNVGESIPHYDRARARFLGTAAFDTSAAVRLRSPLSTVPAGILPRRFRNVHQHCF